MSEYWSTEPGKNFPKRSENNKTHMETKEKIPVPENLDRNISDLIDNLDAAERLVSGSEVRKRRLIASIAGAAAVLAAAVTLGLHGWETRTPEDTFTDPRLAYAAVEKALATISDKAAPALEQTENAGRTIEKTSEIYRQYFE